MDTDQWEGLFVWNAQSHQYTPNINDNETIIHFQDTKDISDDINNSIEWSRSRGNETSSYECYDTHELRYHDEEDCFSFNKSFNFEKYEAAPAIPWNYMDFFQKPYNCCSVDLDILLFQILDSVHQVRNMKEIYGNIFLIIKIESS